MNNNPYKIIYAAVDESYDIKTTGAAIAELARIENIETFVISKNLIKPGQTEYESDNQEQSVSNQMSLMRRMDEIWLVGPSNQPFTMELRVIQHDGKSYRKFYLAGTKLEERTGLKACYCNLT